MTDYKQFSVNTNTGGYAELYTFEEACEIAYSDSIERSCVMMVTHETEYVPRRIYHSGHVYVLEAQP
jgi:hypothetical protein